MRRATSVGARSQRLNWIWSNACRNECREAGFCREAIGMNLLLSQGILLCTCETVSQLVPLLAQRYRSDRAGPQALCSALRRPGLTVT